MFRPLHEFARSWEPGLSVEGVLGRGITGFRVGDFLRVQFESAAMASVETPMKVFLERSVILGSIPVVGTRLCGDVSSQKGAWAAS